MFATYANGNVPDRISGARAPGPTLALVFSRDLSRCDPGNNISAVAPTRVRSISVPASSSS